MGEHYGGGPGISSSFCCFIQVQSLIASFIGFFFFHISIPTNDHHLVDCGESNTPQTSISFWPAEQNALIQIKDVK